jgi:hypothetical protein
MEHMVPEVVDVELTLVIKELVVLLVLEMV